MHDAALCALDRWSAWTGAAAAKTTTPKGSDLERITSKHANFKNGEEENTKHKKRRR